mgnify:CR=1 FL=1
MNILKKIFSILPVAHKDAVKIVFEKIKKSSPDLTPREAEFEAKRLVNKVSSKGGGKVFDPIYAKRGVSKISSADYNDNMSSVFIDISSLYKEFAALNAINSTQKTVLESEFSKSRAAVLKLISDARVFAIRSKYPEFDDIKVINFNINNNKSKRSPIAQVDARSRLLKLPAIGTRRNHLKRRGLRVTSTDVEFITPGDQGHLGLQFNTELATDSKTDTFWAETIYTDSISEVVYNRWSPNEDGELTDVVIGPIAKFNLKFSASESLNQVKILPFSNFPVRVLEITYRSSPGSTIRKTINNFTQEESLDWIEFNFEAIYASDVQVVFAQESYRSFIVNIPKQVLFATDFMIQLIQTRKVQLESPLPNLSDITAGGNSSIYLEAISDLSNLVLNKELDKMPSTELDLAGKLILSVGESLAAFTPNLKNLLEDTTSYTEALPTNPEDIIETITRYEYIIGAREIECNLITYSPVAYYESGKLDTKSTVTNIKLEVDELHPKIDTSLGSFKKTSTEWSIEISEDRVFPIYPFNQAVAGSYPVTDEYLNIDSNSKVGLTRMPSQLAYATIRSNGTLLTSGTEYTLVWTSELDGKLQVTIDDTIFNKKNVYTISYYTTEEVVNIDILAKFTPKKLPAPQVLESTGPDNDVALKFYPYVGYGIINSDDFSLDTSINSYRYTAPADAYTTGKIVVYPKWTNEDGTIITGLAGSASITGIYTGATGSIAYNTLSGEYLTDPHRWYLKFTDVPGAIYEVESFNGASGINLVNIPSLYTGLIGNEIPGSSFSGNVTGQITGDLTGYVTIPYSLEVVYKDGDELFGFDNILYEPVSILVGGIKAKNITDYESLEQPAFSISSTQDGELQYIHDGKTIYFNQAINESETLIDYKWLTKYVKVNCTLRSNKIVTPSITPQINEFRLLLSTTVL